MSDTTHFQYVQKMVVLSEDLSKVLLAKRRGEQDYDGIYSFIGGKMETTDGSFVDGLSREKQEEVGGGVQLRAYLQDVTNILFHKKDGNTVIVAHVACVYVSGNIEINPDEYSDYQWVDVASIDTFEPTIDNVPAMTRWAKQKIEQTKAEEMVVV